MLINEIIKGIKEAPQGLNRKEKTKDDIRDGSTLSVNGRTYEWDKTNNAWYSHNDGDYVRPGSESDYRLTMQTLKMVNPQSKISLNPFKLVKDLAGAGAKRLGLKGIGKQTRSDPKASVMKKTGTVIGGAIGRGIDKIAGTGGFKNNRRVKFDEPKNSPITFGQPKNSAEPKPKNSNVVNLDKKRKKSSILMPGDPDFRK